MARDYLAIPSTSVVVERWFSDGVDVVRPSRSSLNEDSISTNLELNDLLGFGGEGLFDRIMKELNVNSD